MTLQVKLPGSAPVEPTTWGLLVFERGEGVSLQSLGLSGIYYIAYTKLTLNSQ